MNALVKELSKPENLIRALREADQLDEREQWPRNSYLLELAQALCVRQDTSRTEAIQTVMNTVRRMGFKFALKLWEERNPLIDDGK